MANEHQKATRDVIDLKTRPIDAAEGGGIKVIGDCGADFALDGVPVGLSQECDAKFNDVEVVGLLTATGGISAATGVLDMNGQRIIGVDDPTLATDAMNLQYADNNYVNLGGDTMTGFLTLNADPTMALHAATRQWVLTQTSGLATFDGAWFSVSPGAGVWRQNPNPSKAMFVMVRTAGTSDPWTIQLDVAATAGGAVVAQYYRFLDITLGGNSQEDHTALIMVPGGYWWRWTRSGAGGVTSRWEFR